MPSSLEFYKQGYGDRFIDSSYFTEEVREFIKEERKIIDSTRHTFSLLVEVGSMHGRYLDWAVSVNKMYIGLDIVTNYIQMGQEIVASRSLSPEMYQFITGDASEIPYLLKSAYLPVELQHCLLFFPFNSFGNMLNITRILENLQSSQLPFFISSYQTTDYATQCRFDYYKRCGYTHIRVSSDETGACISSSEGLRSIAYHPWYLQKLCNDHCLSISMIPFSDIGMAYVSSSILKGSTQECNK